MLFFDILKFNSFSNIFWNCFAVLVAVVLYFLLGKAVRYAIRRLSSDNDFDIYDYVLTDEFSAKFKLVFKIFWPIYVAGLIVFIICVLIGSAIKNFFKFCLS